MSTDPGDLPITFTPWSQWVRTVSASKVALVTTGGVYLKHGLHEPYDPNRKGGDPTFREFPSVVDLADVAVAGGDDPEEVSRVFPLDQLRDLAAAGAIDSVAPFAYSFSGAVSDPLPLLADSGPAVAYRIRRMGADVVLVIAAGDSGLRTAAPAARLVELAGVPTVVLAPDPGALRRAGVPRGVAVSLAGAHLRLLDALQAAWELDSPGVVEI